LHLRSLCHSCCLSPPPRWFLRPPTPVSTGAGFPCVGLYSGVTCRGIGWPPVCSKRLLEHPGSVGVVEPLKESLAQRLGAPEGMADAEAPTPRQPLNRHARGQPTAGHTTSAASLSVLVSIADTTSSRSSRGLLHHTLPTTGEGSAPPASAVLPGHVLSARLQSSPGTSSAP
jgi:hypothetical protein